MTGLHDCWGTEDTAPPRKDLTRFDPCRERVCRPRFDRWSLERPAHAVQSSRAPERALLFFFCVFLMGCRCGQNGFKRSIEFTKVPPAREGGPAILERIEGRVVGAHSGQQLVLYARSGQWWVQPLTNQPFTKIQTDSKCSNSTHLAPEYAALLLDTVSPPPSIMTALHAPPHA